MKLRTILLLVVLLLSSHAYANDWDKAVDAFHAKDYATSIKIFTGIAKTRTAQAQFIVGDMWRYGMGVPQDLAKAYAFYGLAMINKFDKNWADKAYDRRMELRNSMSEEDIDRGDALLAKWSKGKWD